MALANTRPVNQLPVHSPHTEFSEINLGNNETKIKLSPSQIQIAKTKINLKIENDSNFERALTPKQEMSSDSGSSRASPGFSYSEVSSSRSSTPPKTESPVNDELNEKNKKTDNSEKPKKKYNINPAKQKEKKANKIDVAATGISTTIPVTGERPRPEKDSSLEDEVLFTIFQILYDLDIEGKGMTVKQICDVLLEKHPETAKLSTKTSNLVSAKLNAYVKRVEKGEKTLKYALSREWADTSPKRMVYVYRGILTNDFYIHAMAAMKNLEENFEEKNGDGNVELLKVPDLKKKKVESVNTNNNNNTIFTAKKNSENLNLNNSLFFNNGEVPVDIRITPISIPYNADVIMSPISEPIKEEISNVVIKEEESPISDYDFDELDYFEDEQEDEEDDEDEEELKSNKKRSTRSQHLKISKKHKPVKPLTAAAAAPRVPKNISNIPSPGIVMAAAASLRAAALNALSPDANLNELNGNSKWLKTLREGFLSQEIGTPEDISLAELDSLFN